VKLTEGEKLIAVMLDANHDRHYGVARMFIKHMERWEEFKDRSLNSHGPTLNRYRAMMPVFEQVRETSSIPFSLDDIQSILAA
jgi:uncharacterized protein YfbU (UPF0304 family)